MITPVTTTEAALLPACIHACSDIQANTLMMCSINMLHTSAGKNTPIRDIVE